MKNIKALMMICLLLGGSLIAQETKKDTVIFEESPDTTRISWGKSKIIIVAGEDDEEDSDEPKDHSKTQRYDKFAGIDIGVNGFANPDMGLRLQEEAEFLDLNYGKSISFSINFWESYIPIAKENSTPSQWSNKAIYKELPDIRFDTDIVSIYVYNPNKSTFFVDNLEIRHYKFAP